MGAGGRERMRAVAVLAAVALFVTSVMMIAPAASAAGTSTVTVLRENFENPNFNCDTGWDQDGREMWARGDDNPNSGVDAWCHSQYRIAPSGGSWSAWCAVIGSNSIAPARELGPKSNTEVQRYDANMSSYLRHSLSMDQGLGAGSLTFSYWSRTMASSAPGGFDHLRVTVSVDGSTFTEIWKQPSANEGSWKQATASVPANAKIISFDFISGPYAPGTEWQEGAYIDNILITQASAPSWSHVNTLPAYSPGTFDISISVDAAQGVPESIKLFYRTSGSGNYSLYTDPGHPDGAFSSGEAIRFNSSFTGGELDYQFISVASGGGVIEPQPSVPDASTKVDATPPNVTASLSGTATESGWYNRSVIVHLSAEDRGNGVGSIRYKLDDGDWTVWSGNISIADDGVHVLAYGAADNVGNHGEERSWTIRIDTVAPATLYRVDENGIVTLMPTDDTSGVENAHFRDSGGEWKNYSSHAQMLDAEGPIEYYAVDRAGNIESVRTLDLNSVPMRKVTLEIEGVRENYSSGEAVRLAWACTDPSGMVDHFEVMVDGSSVKRVGRDVASVDLEGLADGGHQILLLAVDGGGNSTFREVALTIGGDGNDGSSTLLLMAIGAVAVAGAVIGALFFRPKRSR